MATYSFSLNGMSLGSGNPAPIEADKRKRGTVQGWSAGAARRNTKFLQSVDDSQLAGRNGWAITFTLREIPATFDAWHQTKERLLDRLRKAAWVDFFHYVIEWQARGAPHLHMAVYSVSEDPIMYTAADQQRWLLRAWLEVAGEFGPEPWCQTVKPIRSAKGWREYQAKHGARGITHYQRSGLPAAGWEVSGHMWGKTKGWPVVPFERAELDVRQGFQARRLAHRWVVEDARRELVRARQSGNAKKVRKAKTRLRWVKGMLSRETDPGKSRFRGISEWMPLSVSLSILEAVGWDGTLKPAA